MHNPVRSYANSAPIMSLAIVLSLLLSSCPSPDENDPPSFPNLEATVTSIDWAGDGVTRGEVEAHGGTDEFPLRVAVSFSVTDSAAGQQALTDRFLSAGLTRVEEFRHSDTFQEDDWQIHIERDGSLQNPAVKVWVNTVGNDTRAAEILAPVADALGTLP